VKARTAGPAEDRIALIPGLQYRPQELNLYSEVDPLRDNIPPLRGARALSYVAVHHKREMVTEIMPTAPALAYMELAQSIVDRHLVKKHSGEPPEAARLKADIKQYAAALGFALCGVTKLDRRFVVEGMDSRFPYETVVVLGMEMNKDFLLQAPNYCLRRYPDYDVYRSGGNQVHRVANFIRRRGVSCSARVPFNGAAIYPGHAITAGLGELGAFGGVLTPQFGPRQRWCMIAIDSPLPVDEPARTGLADFCENCLLCVRKCPAGAIPEEPLWWRGVYKRKIDDLKCFTFFTSWHTCAICINVCPLHRYPTASVLEHFETTGEVMGYDEILAERSVYRGK